MSGPPYRFPDPNDPLPAFFSFWPSDDQDHLRELHYAVLGVNGPVYLLQEDPDQPPKRTTMWDMWMEDRAVGLDEVTFEESKWSERYYLPDGEEWAKAISEKTEESA